MKLFIVISALLLSACASYEKGELPLIRDPQTGEMRPCGHIGVLGDCKHYM
ncbi:hypothetical protein DSM14862_03752 (plasmid) [Sulfitobacter indolifex]|jgi:uncharacterized lipoprotein YmbA|nr:hypothetical protein DSM14862_03355 [Sulfitobacter indolifex]UOA20914.1 hypothetical protein DSM14862_03752 [Sulfitobacter indolifex]